MQRLCSARSFLGPEFSRHCLCQRLAWEALFIWLAMGWRASASDGISLPVKLTFPGAGFASVGVYDAKNEMIRSLSYAQPVASGEDRIEWDGTTDLGLPAAPGPYRVRGVWFAAPPKANYVMKIGLSGNPPYLTDNDRGGWGGNLGPPTGLCANSKELLAVFLCVESPKETGIQLMDFEGNITRRYSSFYGWDGRWACAMDESNAYVAISDAGKKRLFIGKYDLGKSPRSKILCDIPTGQHLQTDGLWKGDWTVDVRGLAVSGGRLYVPVAMDDKLFVVSAESGQILNEFPAPSPRGVAALNGAVFLLSGKNLMRVGADGAPEGAPIVSGLEDPSGLAMDARGNFYVADGGAAQQVRVFAPDGKPLREIGLKGGRPRNGVYNPAGLLDPRAVCVAPDGKVWVTSGPQDFQEITVWNPDGKREKVFYNCGTSSGLGRLSPDRSEMLTAGPGWSVWGMSAYKIDWAQKTWAPSWHLSLPADDIHHDDVLLGTDLSSNNVHPYIAFNKHAPYLGVGGGMVQGTNGRTYLVGGEVSIWLFDPATKTIKLASLVYAHRAERMAGGVYHGFYNSGPNNWLTWSDLNDDGKMSADEVAFTRNVPLFVNTTMFYGFELEPDLSILILAPNRAAGSPGGDERVVKRTVFRLPPKKVLASGVPVYDWSLLQKVVDLQTPDYKGGNSEWKDPNRFGMDQFRTFNGEVYASFFGVSKTKLQMSGVDGDGWWASRNWRMSPMKFDLLTGQPAWLKLGHRAAGVARPGEMYYPGWGMAGSIDGVDYCADALSQVWAWTDDGLYLGRIYNDNPRGAIYDANGIYVELTGSFAYKINGQTYLLTGDHGVSVHQIDVPALTRVDGGTVNLTAAEASRAKPWDPDGPMPGKKPNYVARGIADFGGAAKRKITIDGKLEPEEWEGIPKMDFVLDGKKMGTLQATFDRTNLYLAYDIADANGMKNDGHELPYAPFVSGSYVDFDLGRDWSSPNRETNHDGDVRVILAGIGGASATNYQMAFWPEKKDLRVFKPKPGKLNPADIVSPVQQRHFDDISPVPGLVFAYQTGKQGYTLEVSAPFAALGINPVAQPVIGFDASVGISDAAGQVRERATHWAGESETTVVDRPGSAELKPQTWGTLQFDRTPLQANSK